MLSLAQHAIIVSGLTQKPPIDTKTIALYSGASATSISNVRRAVMGKPWSAKGDSSLYQRTKRFKPVGGTEFWCPPWERVLDGSFQAKRYVNRVPKVALSPKAESQLPIEVLQPVAKDFRDMTVGELMKHKDFLVRLVRQNRAALESSEAQLDKVIQFIGSLMNRDAISEGGAQ